jgi:peptidoglycan/xylan/chitin deacetylase (PgdA/CDA1 family)
MNGEMDKNWLERIAGAIPLVLYRRLIGREVLGFLYHVISNENLPHVRHLYPYKSIAMFEQDLAYLQANFRLISYADFIAGQAGHAPPKSPAALLSFDDGFAQCFSVVRPRLVERGIPAMFFINTDGIDNRCMLYRQKISLCIEKVLSAGEAGNQAILAKLGQALGKPLENTGDFTRWIKSLNYRDGETIGAACQALEVDVDGYLKSRRPYLTAEEIRSLAGEGFTIGGHTRGHPKLNLLSPEEMEDEIAGSCQEIRALTGQQDVPFAFPFSAYGVNRETLAGILARHPYIGKLFDAKGIRKDRAFLMNRIMADKPLHRMALESDLPQHLHRAYQDVFLLKVRRRGIS